MVGRDHNRNSGPYAHRAGQFDNSLWRLERNPLARSVASFAGGQ